MIAGRSCVVLMPAILASRFPARPISAVIAGGYGCSPA
ncbi:unnamed protein product [[Actinomadura] parvosata subsp. kistnae]|nr:unnamed protein product [Actinomadura parvosata subsp. kistnae]